jgi:pimeloyl-ACP methyl ester carboxylesterase
VTSIDVVYEADRYPSPMAPTDPSSAALVPTSGPGSLPAPLDHPDVTRADEVRAIGDLGAFAVTMFTERIEELHHAVSSRSFDAVGAMAHPIRVVHDTVAGTLYSGVRSASGTAVRTLASAVARLSPHDAEALSDTPNGAFARAAINGLLGDRLEEDGSALAIHLAARARGRDVPPTLEGLRAAYPRATPKVAVFLHGLGETEGAWWWRSRGGGHGPIVPFGERLRSDLDFTPVNVRFNSGLRISENGARLATLLHAIDTAWPCEIEEVAFVGHSMGGLVARAAVHVGHDNGHPWTERTEHVVCLGTPHHGAPLEKGVNLASSVLRLVPEAAPLASVLDTRSVGIKDLRWGAVAAEHWRDRHPRDIPGDTRTALQTPSHVCIHAIAATLSASAEHALGSAFGDLLVRLESASGTHRKHDLGIEEQHRAVLGGLSHFDLLGDPQVYRLIRDWLA